MQDFRSNYKQGKSRRTDNNPESGKDKPVIDLIRKSIEGDIEAYGELYLAYVQNIYRYVFSYTREKSLAEDITEEVFLKAWRAIGTCKGREKTFSSWLYRIAHNQVVDELRKLQRRPSVDIDEITGIGDTKSKTEIYSEMQELIQAISGLPENQKQVIILKFIDGRDNREIAEIMRKSEGAIRVLQMRAIRALKDKFNIE
jgi:RNA polymerase sigma-70 factor (ECF subfamily)